MTDIVLPRRSFLVGAASSLIVAPTIVRASSLMDINSMSNRVIVAWRRGESDVWYPSLINQLPFFNHRDYMAWVGSCDINEYKMMRRGDVTGKAYPTSRFVFQRSLQRARDWLEDYEKRQSRNFPQTWLLKRMEDLKIL